MFNTSLICEAIKGFLDYDVIVGGGGLPADFDKGCVIVTLINSKTLTQSYKDFSKIEINQDKTLGNIQSKTLIQNTYQIDLYRQNPINLPYIDVEIQAQNLREYFKSYYSQEYFSKLNASILPTLSDINFLTDFTEQKKIINRAFFTLDVVFEINQTQSVDILDKIAINNLIIGGKTDG